MKICAAAATNNVGVLRELVKSGADMNASDYDMRTGLHLAASEGHVDAVRFFLEEAGVPHTSVDRFGSTPLTDAIVGHNKEVTRLLLSKGARIDAVWAARRMCQAAERGEASTVLTLLESGVSLEGLKNLDGRTPLHLAVKAGHSNVVQVLLEYGADPSVADNLGVTALDDAARSEALASMLKRGARAKSTGAKSNMSVVKAVDPLNQAHMASVIELLQGEGMFRPHIIHSEVDWFYNQLKWHSFYFRSFSPTQVATHIRSYIAAKNVALVTNRRDDVRLALESEKSAIFLVPEDTMERQRTELRIERLVEQRDMPYSLSSFTSEGKAVPFGSKRLQLYILQFYKKPAVAVSSVETDLAKIARPGFSEIPADIQQRYHELISYVAPRMSPAVRTYPMRSDGTVPIMVAARPSMHNTSMVSLTKLIGREGLRCERKMAETFSNGMVVYTFYVSNNAAAIQRLTAQIGIMMTMPMSESLQALFLKDEITANQLAYATALSKFNFYFSGETSDDYRALIKSEKDPMRHRRLLGLGRLMKTSTFTDASLAGVIERNQALFSAIYEDFDTTHNPAHGLPHSAARQQALLERVKKEVAFGEGDRFVLTAALQFNAALLKTNFFQERKAALSFRLQPSFMSELKHIYPEIPYAIFMSLSNDYHGFHVRFRDISRGGIRIIKSRSAVDYAKNNDTVFNENYNLAYTQNLKNKDIPEFGSKGTILLAEHAQGAVHSSFRKYIASILDIIVPGHKNVDHYGKTEILFMGPDENTADLMDWACEYSKHRGYKQWRSFTTGKAPRLGGIPHDTYGMTTRSVHKYVTELLADLGVDETKITKFQTGGPDGDLGSNEIKMSKDVTIAIVDGSGVLYDPKGLARNELVRLANARSMISEFDTSKLSASGFRVLLKDKNFTLPSGEVVSSGNVLRDTFHLHPLSSADLFVPCGGRPESVTASNVHRMFDEAGKPRFKWIVEGANLFITPEARIVLEDAGVVLFKDASANKGGVTSSSCEVLAALGLDDEEFAANMSVPVNGEAPAFYKLYVQEVQERVEENARREYRAIQREVERAKARGLPAPRRSELTNRISDKINEMVDSVSSSDLFEDEHIRNVVLAQAIPASLSKLIGSTDKVVERLPENYKKALFSAALGSTYVYKYGLGASEFDFYAFINACRHGAPLTVDEPAAKAK